DVEHFLADEPVSAYREPLWARGRRWLRRHRGLAGAALAALLVGAATLGVATLLLAGKNEALRQGHAREAAAHRAARAKLELANHAAEDYLLNVAEDPRLKERDLSALRKRLLLSAGAFYRKFAEGGHEDPALELMRGRACLNLGFLHRELSETR